jgi:cysteine desulfuration protein SufE
MNKSDLSYFEELDNWAEKYEYIVELGQKVPEFNEKNKINENRIIGCQSRVWLILSWDQNQLLKIQCYADSRLVQGLLALCILVYDNQTREEIKKIGSSWLQNLGLKDNLSLVRRQGLESVIRKVLEFCE